MRSGLGSGLHDHRTEVIMANPCLSSPATQLGGEAMQPQDPTFAEEMTRRNTEALQDEIARRAYELYEARGYVDGFDIEDWLQAEQDIVGWTPASKAATGR
jgi:DUF2934 family protein